MKSIAQKTVLVLILFIFSSQLMAESQIQFSQTAPITKQLTEVRGLSNGEACVYKAATHSIAGFVSGVAVDCLIFACANTVIAAVIGIVGGGTEGCVEGILEN
ncbi:MAG: hypothetical protein ACXVB6_05945 [Mucilaginibacter sp.]